MKKLFIIVLFTFLNSIPSVNAMEHDGRQIPAEILQATRIEQDMVQNATLDHFVRVNLQRAQALVIGYHAWNRCDELREVVLPPGCTEIEEGAFNLCRSLAVVVFPETLATIGWGAFDGCGNLVTVALPASLRHVCRKAFRQCYRAEVSIRARSTDVQLDTVGVFQRGPFADCRPVVWVNG